MKKATNGTNGLFELGNTNFGFKFNNSKQEIKILKIFINSWTISKLIIKEFLNRRNKIYVQN